MAYATLNHGSAYLALDKLEEAARSQSLNSRPQHVEVTDPIETEPVCQRTVSHNELQEFGDFSDVEISRAQCTVENTGDQGTYEKYDITASINNLPLNITFTTERLKDRAIMKDLKIIVQPDLKSDLLHTLNHYEEDCNLDGCLEIIKSYCHQNATREEVFHQLLSQLGDKCIKLPQPGVLLFGKTAGPKFGIMWDIITTPNAEVQSTLQLVIKTNQTLNGFDKENVLGDMPEVFTDMVRIFGAAAAVSSIVRTACSSTSS